MAHFSARNKINDPSPFPMGENIADNSTSPLGTITFNPSRKIAKYIIVIQNLFLAEATSFH
jgi:hypothetical protein